MVGAFLASLGRSGAAVSQRCSQVIRSDLNPEEVIDSVRRSLRFLPVRVSLERNRMFYVSNSVAVLERIGGTQISLEGRSDIAVLADLGELHKDPVRDPAGAAIQERDLILANLDLLFNSQPVFDSIDEESLFPETACSVLNGGLPLFYGSKTAPMTEQRVVDAILNVIRRFEPRLRSDSLRVIVEGYDDLPNRSTIRVLIYGEPRADPYGQGLEFTTDLCFLTKRAERVSG